MLSSMLAQSGAQIDDVPFPAELLLLPVVVAPMQPSRDEFSVNSDPHSSSLLALYGSAGLGASQTEPQTPTQVGSTWSNGKIQEVLATVAFDVARVHGHTSAYENPTKNQCNCAGSILEPMVASTLRQS